MILILQMRGLRLGDAKQLVSLTKLLSEDTQIQTQAVLAM